MIFFNLFNTYSWSSYLIYAFLIRFFSQFPPRFNAISSDRLIISVYKYLYYPS